MKEKINIIWFKRDLRVTDHEPIFLSSQDNYPTIAIYIFEPSVMNFGDYSNFHQYWVQESLKNLKKNLNNLNINLYIFYWEVLDILRQIFDNYDINIFAHEETGNRLTFERDLNVMKRCKHNNIYIKECINSWIIRRLKNRNDWHKIRKERMNSDIFQVEKKKNLLESEYIYNIYKNSMKDFPIANKPEARNYDRDLPWEDSAQKRFNYFLKYLIWRYMYNMSRPHLAFEKSSRLSAYIAYGNISIKYIYQECKKRQNNLKLQLENCKNDDEKKYINSTIRSLTAFESRLHRRDHFIQKLESQPSIEYQNQNSAFDEVRSKRDDNIIQLWQNWMTWIPLIDAVMRCLKSTWWINFRMRAMTVSFITNTCMQDRKHIAHYLARVFVDYEPWIHYSQLQMQSATTWINTIRIYNPEKQLAEKDEDMLFIKKRVPEYLSESYKPIIDIKQANRQAREILRSVKKDPKTKDISKKVYEKLWSRVFNTKKQKKDKYITPGLFE